MGQSHNAIDDAERALIDLLIKLNILTQAQVTECLEFQCRLPPSQHKPLEVLLVDMEFLTPSGLAQARELLAHDQPESATVSLRDSLNQEMLNQESLQGLFQHRPQAAQIPAVTKPAAKPRARTRSAARNEPLGPDDQAPDQAATPADTAFPAPDPSAATLTAATPSPPVTPAAPPVTPPPPSQPQAAGAFAKAAGAFAQRRPQNTHSVWAPAGPQARTGATAPITPAIPSQLGPEAHLPKPQLGEILLKNHDLEEWQLTHALCIQRADPKSTPKLGTLLVRLGYVLPQAVERALGMQVKQG